MNPVLKTKPDKLPVELKAVMEHVNIIPGWTEDDEVLKALNETATKKAEQYLRRRLITQSWYAYYDAWPTGTDAIILPYGKLQSVTTIKYTDTDGDQTTWSDTEYNVDTYSDPGRIVLEYGYTWPTTTLHPQNPIEVDFICGYGDTGADVEDMIKHAIKIIIGDYYNNREDMLIGMTAKDLKISKDLLMPYRLHGIPTE